MLGFRDLFIITLLASTPALASNPATVERSIREMNTSTLLEWSQNLEQTCSRDACRNSKEASRVRTVLRDELKNRFLEETGESIESIPLTRWTTFLESRSDGDRCQLLRTAFVLSLVNGTEPSHPSWRLFTNEQPLSALTRLGHRPLLGSSPICPDYFFPESDVLEQAIERGERLFQGSALTPGEAQSRVQVLEKRYLTRGTISRSPAN